MSDTIMEEGDESNGSVEPQEEVDTLVINTKTMCFLCLGDIARERQQEGGEEKNEFSCFGTNEGPINIKIEPGLSPPPRTVPSSSLPSSLPPHPSQGNNILSVLSVVRHLNVNWSDVYARYLDIGGVAVDVNVPERVSNISVMLCEDCTAVASKLSTLCLELELLKMRVHGQLQSFCRILQKSERDQERVDQLRNLTSDDDDSASHGSLADVLRMEMKSKCIIQEKSVLPRIMIPKPGPGRKAKPPHRASEAAPKGHLVQCHLCRPRRHLQPTEVRPHKIYHHVETFMTQYQLRELSLSMDEFKEYCDYVFKVELMLCPKVAGGLKCSSCDRVYTCNYSLRYHLFSEHKALLGRKLSELQRSTTIDEVRSIQLNAPFFNSSQEIKTERKVGRPFKSSRGPIKKKGMKPKRGSQLPFRSLKGEICKLCDPPSDARYRILKLHVIRNHAESFFTKCKLPHLSMSDFKQYCDHVIQVELLSTSKRYKANGNPATHCSLCSKCITNVIHMRGHLIYNHRDILSKKIVELQNSTSPSEIKTATANLSKMSLGCYKCINCGSTFSQESSLYRHLKLQCTARGGKAAKHTVARRWGRGPGRPRKVALVEEEPPYQKKEPAEETCKKELADLKPSVVEKIQVVHPKMEMVYHDENDEENGHPLEQYLDVEMEMPFDEEEEASTTNANNGGGESMNGVEIGSSNNDLVPDELD